MAMALVDTGILYAIADVDDAWHNSVSRIGPSPWEEHANIGPRIGSLRNQGILYKTPPGILLNLVFFH
jgi:hypothetical protein